MLEKVSPRQKSGSECDPTFRVGIRGLSSLGSLLTTWLICVRLSELVPSCLESIRCRCGYVTWNESTTVLSRDRNSLLVCPQRCAIRSCANIRPDANTRAVLRVGNYLDPAHSQSRILFPHPLVRPDASSKLH